jgi:hypothetical protein
MSKFVKSILFAMVFILWAVGFSKRAKTDENISIDAMVVPSSPGFVLLGIEPASIERPGTVMDLTFSVLNRLGNTEGLPKDVALELAPYWLFGGRNLTYDQYADYQNILANIIQTGSVSIASASGPDSSLVSLAFGLRFSILRGKIDDEFESYKRRLDSLRLSLKELNAIYSPYIQQRMERDELVTALDSAWFTAERAGNQALMDNINVQKTLRLIEIKAAVDKEFADSLVVIRKLASDLRLKRIGWKLDIAGGTVAMFPDRIFDNGKTRRWGAWATGGYEWKNWSALGVMRYLGDRSQSDLSSLDLGGRLIVDIKKLSLSAEAVSRSFPNLKSRDNIWRLDGNADYAIAKNKSLSLTIGRDFGGNYSGSLITLLNLVFGFGSDRPVE